MLGLQDGEQELRAEIMPIGGIQVIRMRAFSILDAILVEGA